MRVREAVSPERAVGLTWLAWVGLGCPPPDPEECWSPRSTSSAGSPCSERPPLEQGRLPAVCLQGGVSRPTLGRRHRGLYFRGACVAWWASVFWLETYNWGWRCRAWCRCHCHSSLPWKRGLALAPGSPGGRTIGHHYGCWRRCWRGYCCWNGLSTEVHPGRQGRCVILTLGMGASALTGTLEPDLSIFWLLPYWYSNSTRWDLLSPSLSLYICKMGLWLEVLAHLALGLIYLKLNVSHTEVWGSLPSPAPSFHPHIFSAPPLQTCCLCLPDTSRNRHVGILLCFLWALSAAAPSSLPP